MRSSAARPKWGMAEPTTGKAKFRRTRSFQAFRSAMTGSELNGWFYYGGGMELYHEVYAPFGVIPFPIGNSGTQMGGWFNKEINSVDDLKGLKMRIPGFGGEVLKRIGGTPVNIPGPNCSPPCRSGTIDATEWVGPMNDLAFGLFRAARLLLLPGLARARHCAGSHHQRRGFRSAAGRPPGHRGCACKAANMDMFANFEARNGEALKN